MTEFDKNEGLSKIVVSPEVWPGREIEAQPGDFSQIAPHGEQFYGYQSSLFQSINGAPSHEANAGIIYFDNGVRKGDFEGFLRMMGIGQEHKDYAAFVCKSSNPGEDGFLRQMRLVSRFGLRYMFKAIDNSEYEAFPNQTLNVGEALLDFIESEKKEYGTDFGASKLAGTFGGDGHYKQEKLSFGFMLENSYYDIYRIWSRAWLVTK